MEIDIRKFLRWIREGKIGVDKRLLKPHHLDYGRVSDRLKYMNFPTIQLTKTRPLDYLPAVKVYGIEVQGWKNTYYLSPRSREVLGDIVKLLGPGNEHFWVNIWNYSILPEEKTAEIPRGEIVKIKTIFSPEETMVWASFFKSTKKGKEYVDRLKLLNNRLGNLRIQVCIRKG